MKLLLTSAAFEKNLKIGKEFLKLVGKKPSAIKVFVVSTAKKGNKDWRWVKLTVSQLGKIGIIKENIFIFSLDRKVKEKELEDIDVIYICGGNTFVYLDRIRKTGFDKIIKESVKKGVVYFGVSAGSYLACPNIEAATWKHVDRNIVNLKDLTSLGFVPFWLTAHFARKYKLMIKKAAEITKYPIIALRDNQAVLVNGKEVRIIGPGKKITFNLIKKL